MTGWRGRRTRVLLVGLLATSACTPPPLGCTDIGAATGIAVTVDAAVAAEVTDLTLTICRAGRCTDTPVELAPGSVTVGQTCTGSAPDDVCSASAAPDGTAVGFAVMDSTTAEPVSVRAGYRSDRRPVSTPPLDVTLRGVYPNGPDCGVAGYQAAVRLTPAGLEVAR